MRCSLSLQIKWNLFSGKTYWIWLWQMGMNEVLGPWGDLGKTKLKIEIEFKILCTFLYKDWILFPGWKDGVSCIMHIRPPHQCQDVLHDQPDIPSPLVQCINKLFMFAIVLDTHVEILFISGYPEGGLSITLYPPLSIVFASSYWKVLMILVNIILKIKYVHCKQISRPVDH